MMLLRKLGLLLVASAACFTHCARAADAEAARGCAEIGNDAERLACYDRFYRPTARPEPAGPLPTAPDAGGSPATVGANDFREFGLSETDKRRALNLPAGPDSINLTIESVSRRPTGEQVFRTTEGQVWVEVEPYSRVRVGSGDPVTIRKGAIGSYVLVTASRAGTKVRRLN